MGAIGLRSKAWSLGGRPRRGGLTSHYKTRTLTHSWRTAKATTPYAIIAPPNCHQQIGLEKKLWMQTSWNTFVEYCSRNCDNTLATFWTDSPQRSNTQTMV